jgi:hypothetical protein
VIKRKNLLKDGEKQVIKKIAPIGITLENLKDT